MSHPTLWPFTYFYPNGNSPAVCLTESLPAEEAAEVLLLGCGDPRSILYTLHVEPPTKRSSLNFTCCDIEPGVIARNVLLFSLIVDGHEDHYIWNIFYHAKLDSRSFSVLMSQIKKLLGYTIDLAAWEKSSYSKFLQFCSTYTLSQVHSYLEVYAQAEQYTEAKHRQMFSCFTRTFEARIDPDHVILDHAFAAALLEDWDYLPFERRGYRRQDDKSNILPFSELRGHPRWGSLRHSFLLNILVATAPLLSQDPAAVLYTEVKLSHGGAEKGLVKTLCIDAPTTGLLLGIAPFAAVAHFASKSKVETLLAPADSSYRDRIGWKAVCVATAVVSPSFPDAVGLADILFRIYIEMFPEEMGLMAGSARRRDRVHYNRGTFAALLGLVKSRLRIDWTKVMNRLFDLIEADRTLIVGSNYYQELCCQLHLQGVYSVDTLGPRREPVARPGVFRDWVNVPPVVCLVLVVPRQSIQVIEERSAKGTAGSPIFQCGIRGRSLRFHSIFSCIQIALGKVSARGSGQDREVSIIEDPEGWSGSSPLVVSVLVPAFNLVSDPELTQVSLSLHSTPETIPLMRVLGMWLELFTADISDKRSVYVTMNRPNCSSSPVGIASIPSAATRDHVPVTLRDGQISTLTGRWDLTQNDLGECGGSLKEAKIGHSQISLCAMELVINEAVKRKIVYPFPVDGLRAKLRIARKSGWIEMEVPVRPCVPSAPVDFCDTSFFARNRLPALWNLHRVNLASLPAVELGRNPDQRVSTLETHIMFALSDQECQLVRQKKCDARDLLVRVKETILQLFTNVVGANKARVFVFPTGNGQPDTIIYINGVRMDIAADTFILDVGVLPVTDKLLKGPLGSKVRAITERPEVGTASLDMTSTDEAEAWKHLFAAFTERCRTWSHREDTCRYASSGNIPVSVKGFEDPLCGCGEGHDLGAVSRDPQWKELAPRMTRGAISPLFFLGYLDTLDERLKELTSSACAACGKSNVNLRKCGRCKEVEYCSKECQTGHWKTHKKGCKA
ncbi:hypothetical protein FB45DRAFT_1089047 [Roridomyces roridus]|uniref:MYND-type domain-containing protein n=1 Tax=Roridomyces roridus TaxID=1738132 RepID=A0AAD7FJB6_9AGAR|nr:hypothetical protein FB45DRAFT_1089047 [Roridomyces roridus]